jgi:hypothetical protein
MIKFQLELELELIQPQVPQKPVLRGKVGARAVSVERGGMGERGCTRRLGDWVWVRSRFGHAVESEALFVFQASQAKYLISGDRFLS